MRQDNRHVYALLFAAVWITAFAGALIKIAEAPALSIAAWRLGLATLILFPFMLLRMRRSTPALRASWPWLLLSGLALAVHFATWVASLKYTSVASSVILVTTHPLFVGLGSHFLLKERIRSGLAAGILVSVVGGVLIGYGDFRIGGEALLGDLLAIAGALGASAYFLIGRRVRAHVELSGYVFLVYGVAALLLLGSVVFSRTPLWGFPKSTYLILVLLAVGPQLIGHSTFNWALRHVSAPMVSVAILGEPVGATIIAALWLHEPVTGLKLLGGGLILTGVYLAMRGEGASVGRAG